jgi:ketosteroid isomerase-like protein
MQWMRRCQPGCGKHEIGGILEGKMRLPKQISTALITLAAVAAAAAGAGADSGPETAERAWARAVVQRDFATLEKILAADLIYAHSTGVIENKQQYLGKLRSGVQRYDAIEHGALTVRLYGDAAVVHSQVTMRGVNASGPFNDRLMMLHVWIKQGGAWRLAAHQTTKLS